MVSALHGTLLSCDPPLKEIIKAFDAAEEGTNKFILAELPDGKLFIKADRVEYVQQKVRNYSDALHFEPRKDHQQ